MRQQAAKTSRRLIGLGWFSEADEQRAVSMCLQADGSCWMGEHSCGDSTRAAYDAEAYQQKIHLSEAGIEQLSHYLGVRSQELPRVFQRFFADGTYFLSDVLDLLDKAHIGYRYSAEADSQALLR